MYVAPTRDFRREGLISLHRARFQVRNRSKRAQGHSPY